MTTDPRSSVLRAVGHRMRHLAQSVVADLVPIASIPQRRPARVIGSASLTSGIAWKSRTLTDGDMVPIITADLNADVCSPDRLSSNRERVSCIDVVDNGKRVGGGICGCGRDSLVSDVPDIEACPGGGAGNHESNERSWSRSTRCDGRLGTGAAALASAACIARLFDSSSFCMRGPAVSASLPVHASTNDTHLSAALLPSLIETVAWP